MPSLRLPLLAPDAVARLRTQAPLIAYASSAALATIGAALIYMPAGFLVLAAFCLAISVLALIP